MNESNKLGIIAEKIISYEEQYHVSDSEFALLSHLSVERIHAIKAGKIEPTDFDVRSIMEALNKEPNFE